MPTNRRWRLVRFQQSPFVIALAILVTAGVLITYFLPRTGSVEKSPHRVAHSPNGSCHPADAEAKGPLRGIVTIGALPQEPASFIGGMSTSVAWADLQPRPDGPIVHPNAIDAAIDAVRRQTPVGECSRGIKVRVLAGIHAPKWAKTLDGSPLRMSLPQDQLSGTVPRFWTARFGLAYDTLQRELAAAYDDVAEIREVAMTRCTTFYAEPLLRQVSIAKNAAVLSSAGLTDAADRKCLAEQITAHQVWMHTPSSLALNPYLSVTSPTPNSVGTLDVTLEAARTCRRQLSQRCILANNSLRWPIPPGSYSELYAAMIHMGGPLEFQTASARRVGDLVAAVRWAIAAGAASVETGAAATMSSGAALSDLSAAARWGPSG